MVGKRRIWGARGEGLSGSEGLLAVVSLEVTTKGIRTGTGMEKKGREFQISGAATLKLREPNDVWTNGAERRLVLESLRERVE